jgi:hypothetical protein
MDTTCVECYEQITNPICSHCLTTEMKSMVNDRKLASQIIPCDIEGDVTCIKCNRQMGLCAHCFSRDIYEFIKTQNKNLAKEFINRFDFDLRRSLFNSLGSKIHSHPEL